MKKITFLLSLLFLISSCDDGDIIVTDFDFEDATLLSCGDIFEPTYIFYKINQDSNESIALQFTTTEPIFTVPNTEDVYEITLSGSDKLSYRRFNETVPTDYFCNAIPPSTPIVQEEFISTDGLVKILTLGTLVDDDGIDSENEDPTGMIDTDMDGLYNIYDFDDDGDNVPTRLEGVAFIEGTNVIDIDASLDTDDDGTPNYLDDDDDGDGVLTRNEDANMDGNPTNDTSSTEPGAPDDYLNDNIVVETIVNFYREHTYFVTGLTLGIEIENINLINQANQSEQRDETTQDFGTFTSSDVEVTTTPDFN